MGSYPTRLKTESRLESDFLRFFFDFLKRERVHYVVIRNYETLPETVTGTDIDLIISRKQYMVCREKLIREAGRVGYRKWKEYPKNFGIVQMSFVPEICYDPQDVVRIDFIFDNMKWLGFDIVDRRLLWKNRIEKNGIWALAEPIKTGLTLLNTFLYRGKLKEKYLLEYRNLETGNREIVNGYLLDSFGAYGKFMVSKLQDGSIEDIHKFNTRKIQLSFLESRGFDLKAIFRGCWSWFKTGFKRVVGPPGLFVVLIGPDGCGKSTLSEMLGTKCKRMFPGISNFHLFPKLKLFAFLDKISRARWEKRQKKSSEWEQRNKDFSTGKSLLRCFYLLIRFWMGYWFWVYPRLVKGHLIIGERWRYDILFDPASKGIGLPYWVRKIIFWLCPAPQKTIVLSGSAEEMAKRKEELPQEEIERQVQMIEKELCKSRNVVFADSTGDLDMTFGEVLNAICN